jgi:hypothetical protein
MDNKAVQSLIKGLFSVEAALGKYRQQYSDEIVESFLIEKVEYLSEYIAVKIVSTFEEHAKSVGMNGAEGADSCVNNPNNTTVDVIFNEVNKQNSENLSPEVKSQIEVGETIKIVAEPATTKLTDLSAVDGAAVDQIPKAVLQDKNNQSHAQGDTMPRKFSFQLKGGKLQASVPYEGRIEFSEGPPGVVPRILSVEMQPELGLQFDKEDPARIFGTPTTGGDVELVVKYNLDGPAANPIELKFCISKFINHDPKTLWKNLPSDINDPHWKPDSDSILLEADVRKVVAASQRGRSHAHEGKFRDDDFKIHVSDCGWHIVVVADGAGSAIKSRRGSQIAVATVVNELLQLLASDDGAKLEKSVADWREGKISKEHVVAVGLYPVLGVAAFKTCKAIEEEAAALGVAAKEFSTTLLVTIYKKMPFGELFATYWVGDGGVGIFLKDGTPKLLGKVDSGEYAGQTRFLDYKVMTTEEITARLHFEVVDDFKALIAMTDGITDPWFMTDNNLESKEYWEKLWVEVEPALQSDNPKVSLLAWLDFWSPGNHDDRTIAIFW